MTRLGLRKRLDRVEAVLSRRRHALDLVDLLTRMRLSVEDPEADAAAVWHGVRERLGVKDDGSGEERVEAIRDLVGDTTVQD